MKTLSTAAALAALVLVPAPARAATPLADGQLCGYSMMSDPTGPDGTMTGYLEGGPVFAVADDLAGNPVSVTLTCTIQTGWDLSHAGTDAVSASASGTGVAVLPPTPYRFTMADPWEPLSLCTEVILVDGHGETHHLYWDDSSNGGAHDFSTSPTAKCFGPCNLAFPSNCDPPPCEDEIGLHCRVVGFHTVPAVFDAVSSVFVDVVDPAICPVLVTAYPPEGDVPNLWDCPPYES